MKNTKALNWGITKDLQADIRYEPNACKGYVMDISLGCPHHCTYCLFSQLELNVYKLQNPSYKGDVLPLKLDKFMKRTSFPPAVYMCYSSDPLGSDELKVSTKKVLKKLFEHNVSILFISKGIFDDDIIDIIKTRPDLMNIQVDISSCDDKRNEFFEPGAPSYAERIKNLERLSKIEGLDSLVVRMDPLLPNIDDTPDNIMNVLKDIKKYGVNEITTGYIVLTPGMLKSWNKHELANKVVEAMTEKTPTISSQVLYSIPLEDKLERFKKIQRICENMGIKMSVCGCKDVRYKQTDLEWICHPYNRGRREALRENASEQDLIVELDHLA